MIGRCGTCKWWEQVKDGDQGFCENSKVTAGDAYEAPVDGTDAPYTLYTGKLFGCVHHELKPAQ